MIRRPPRSTLFPYTSSSDLELIEMIRAKVEPETFAEYELRARDLFTQQVCWAKLDLAIRAGITQENQTIPAETFQPELDESARARAEAIRQAILTELDLQRLHAV